MKRTPHIHSLKINCNLTDEIKQFVYLYIIEGKRLHLIDSGIKGASKYLKNYLMDINRDIEEIDSIFLTHCHLDHIGGAKEIQALSGCKIYCSKEEKQWIENSLLQRPYKLAGTPVQIDEILHHNDVIQLEDNITLNAVDTKGHSKGHLAFFYPEEKALFTGDAIPLIGELPIYLNIEDSLKSLDRLLAITSVNLYLSPWDQAQGPQAGREIIQKAIHYLKYIKNTVNGVIDSNKAITFEDIFNEVCQRLNLGAFKNNLLFRKAIYGSM